MSDKIDDLLEERGKQWGDATLTHVRIAQVWSGILDQEVSSHQVALCMAGLKLVRASISPDAQDSYDDGHGYLTIAERIIFGATEEDLALAGERVQQLRRALTVTDTMAGSAFPKNGKKW